jgi:hypothetical protein
MTVSSVKTGEVGLSFALNNNYMEPIATTLLSSTASGITFSDIPQNYKHLQLIVMARSANGADTDYCNIQFNSDVASNYAQHRITANGTTASAGSDPNITRCIAQRLSSDVNSANIFGALIFDIIDYNNANKFKTTRHLGAYDSNGSGFLEYGSNLWQSTIPISSIFIYSQTGSGFKQYSRFSLYGIKG